MNVNKYYGTGAFFTSALLKILIKILAISVLKIVTSQERASCNNHW